MLMDLFFCIVAITTASCYLVSHIRVVAIMVLLWEAYSDLVNHMELLMDYDGMKMGQD